MGRYLEEPHTERVQAFVRLAEAAGISPARLALAWCLAQPGVDAVIVGATRSEHVTENARAVDIELSEDLLRRLEELFPA